MAKTSVLAMPQPALILSRYAQLSMPRFVDALVISDQTKPAQYEDEACIRGKRYFVGGQLSTEVHEFTPQEILELEELLYRLPKLTSVMPQAKRDQFLEAFRQLPDPLPWEPVLYTEAESREHQAAAEQIRQIHLARLIKWFRTGRLTSPKTIFRFSSELPDELPGIINGDDANIYLAACGKAWTEHDFVRYRLISPPLPIVEDHRTSTTTSSADLGSADVTHAPHPSSIPADAGRAEVETTTYPPLSAVMQEDIGTEQAAFYLGRKKQTLLSWSSKGNGLLRPKRVGGRLMWSAAEIRALLK